MQKPVAFAALDCLAAAWRARRSDDGQDLLEYALLVALIAIIAAGAVGSVGTTIQTVFWTAIAKGMAAAGGA